MPTYEIALVLRVMSRPSLMSTLKRTAEAVFEKGGIIRKIENLGTRQLPFRTKAHGIMHRQGSYFVMQFDAPPTALIDLNDGFSRDVDIIRPSIFKVQTDPEFECTLAEELKPPAYRSEVQKMVEEGKKKEKRKYNANTGLDYYPFQK